MLSYLPALCYMPLKNAETENRVVCTPFAYTSYTDRGERSQREERMLVMRLVPCINERH